MNEADHRNLRGVGFSVINTVGRLLPFCCLSALAAPLLLFFPCRLWLENGGCQ